MELPADFLSLGRGSVNTDMYLSLFFHVFIVDLLLRILSLICYDVFCSDLKLVVVSLIVSFFMSFHVSNSDDKVRLDKFIRPNFIG